MYDFNIYIYIIYIRNLVMSLMLVIFKIYKILKMLTTHLYTIICIVQINSSIWLISMRKGVDISLRYLKLQQNQVIRIFLTKII